MQPVTQEIFDALAELDSATIFNAVVENLGGSQGGLELESKGGHPENYAGPEIRCLLPELGRAVGTVVTAEVTTNDPDSEGIPWDEYYEALDKISVPIVAVIKDVDSRPGRGAAFGDGMAKLHKALGVTGAILEGSVRDLMGVKDAGLPIWANGTVPGHGVFNLIRVNASITVARLRVHPGEIMIADTDGCTKIPKGHDPEDILRIARKIQAEEKKIFDVIQAPDFTLAKWKALRNS